MRRSNSTSLRGSHGGRKIVCQVVQDDAARLRLPLDEPRLLELFKKDARVILAHCPRRSEHAFWRIHVVFEQPKGGEFRIVLWEHCALERCLNRAVDCNVVALPPMLICALERCAELRRVKPRPALWCAAAFP